MNIHHDLDHLLQYEFLINIVRPRKRFSKWFKKEQDSDVEAVAELVQKETDTILGNL